MEEEARRTEEVIYQICRVCKQRKPLREFHRKKDAKLGSQSICKECCLHRAKKYYLDNKEQIDARTKKYNFEHKEQRAEYTRRYRLEHKEEEKARFKKYREEHKEQIAKQQRDYCLKHKKQIAERNKQWWQTKRGHSLGTTYNHRRRARKAEVEGDGVSPEEFERIIQGQGGKCNMCGKRFCKSRRATMDHIIPLSKGGPHISSNIQALCGSCNSEKHAKIMKCFINSWCL